MVFRAHVGHGGITKGWHLIGFMPVCFLSVVPRFVDAVHAMTAQGSVLGFRRLLESLVCVPNSINPQAHNMCCCCGWTITFSHLSIEGHAGSKFHFLPCSAPCLLLLVLLHATLLLLPMAFLPIPSFLSYWWPPSLRPQGPIVVRSKTASHSASCYGISSTVRLSMTLISILTKLACFFKCTPQMVCV